MANSTYLGQWPKYFLHYGLNPQWGEGFPAMSNVPVFCFVFLLLLSKPFIVCVVEVTVTVTVGADMFNFG